MKMFDILKQAVDMQASDIFLVPGTVCSVKCLGVLERLNEERLMPDAVKELIEEVYTLASRPMNQLIDTGDDDFSFSIGSIGRFRGCAYKQRNSLAMVLRIVSFDLPNYEELGIPVDVMELANEKNGMILVSGPAGSGKSTTLACMIDRINSTKAEHVITIEDPIEYIHRHKKSIVSQREVSHDTDSYAHALRASLRQAPDTILVGEMRDYETIQTALTAAETGHLLLSTLHTVGAAKTIDRIIDVFPSSQQQQVRIQLSMVLRAVISQQLVPTVDGQLVAVFEVMKVNGAIANMIRESKTFQIDNVIFSQKNEGMRTMDGELYRLYLEGRITKETALMFAINPSSLSKKLV